MELDINVIKLNILKALNWVRLDSLGERGCMSDREIVDDMEFVARIEKAILDTEPLTQEQREYVDDVVAAAKDAHIIK